MNPAVLLPLLANPISNTPLPDVPDAISGVPSSNLSELSPKGCFLPSPGAPLKPIIYADCVNGIIRAQMSTYPDMDKFLIWSRDKTETTDIKVPYVRYYQSCALVLSVESQSEYERDSMGDVIRSALTLAKDCVIQPPHRGGQKNLGSRGRLQLTIVRRPRYPLDEGGWLQGNGSGSLAIAGGDPDESSVDVT